jgi:hypothetical protein
MSSETSEKPFLKSLMTKTQTIKQWHWRHLQSLAIDQHTPFQLAHAVIADPATRTEHAQQAYNYNSKNKKKIHNK